jgi:putative membrane protein
MKSAKTLLCGACACACLLAYGCDKNHDNDSSLNDTDRDFMVKASYGNNSEVDAAQLATSKTAEVAVKNFAQMMITDHTTAQNDLKNLATKKTVGIPSGPDSAHIAMKNQLSALAGRAFDSAYMHGQLNDHVTVINLMQNEISNGKDGDVKNYANTYLPKVQMHKRMVDSIITAMNY